MKLGQRISSVWRGIKAGATHPADLLGMLELLTRSHESGSGAVVNPVTAMRVAAVYACVNVIGEALGSMPIMVYRRLPNGGGKVPAPEHPLMKLFKYPNPWQNRMEFIEMMSTHVCLRGNAYAFINEVTNVGTGKAFIAELLPLHPDCVRVEVGDDKMPRYYYRPYIGKTQGQEILIPWEKMMHLRFKSYDGYTGISPIAAARDVVGMGITLQDHAGSLFKRGAHTGGVLEHPETLTDEVAKRIRDSWQETYAGAQNSGKVVVLEEGMKYNAVGMSMADAQYIETRKLNRAEIASIYRVPAHKIGAATLERMSYNSIEMMGVEFVTDCLLAWCTRWELMFERDLVRADDTYFVKFNLNAYMRGDITATYTAFKMGRDGGWLSPDDIREVLDMNPIPDGKGKIYLQPVNFVPLGTPPAPQPEPGAPPKDPAKNDADRIIEHATALAKAFREAGVGATNVTIPLTVNNGDVTVPERSVHVAAGDTIIHEGDNHLSATVQAVGGRTKFIREGDDIVGSETQPLPPKE